MIIIIITIVVIIIIITRRELKNGRIEIQDSFLRNILKTYKKRFEENNKTVKPFGMEFKKLYI